MPRRAQGAIRSSKEPKVLPSASRAQTATRCPKEPRVIASRYPKSKEDYIMPQSATSAPMNIGLYQVIQRVQLSSATRFPRETRMLAGRCPKEPRIKPCAPSAQCYPVSQKHRVLPGVIKSKECLLSGASNSSKSYLVPQEHSATRYP